MPTQELGHKFAALNRDLEELTKSIPPSHKISMDDVVADDLRAGDQFGSLLLKAAWAFEGTRQAHFANSRPCQASTAF
jgi:hypothetical protein